MKLGKVLPFLPSAPKKVKALKLLSPLCPTGTVFIKQKAEIDGKKQIVYVVSGLEPKKYNIVAPSQEGENTSIKTYNCPAYYTQEVVKAHLKNKTGYFSEL